MFKGSFVALVTPFRNGAVDYARLEQLIDFHVRDGTSGLSPCGTTGESATLTTEEHKEVIAFVVKHAAGGCRSSRAPAPTARRRRLS